MSGRRWLPPLLWAAVILVATSWPSPHVPNALQIEYLDKVVHATMYGLLGVLATRAFWDARRPWRSLLLVVACISLMGALDEWHQQFIPGRSMEVGDWLADTIGAALGSGLALALLRREITT